MKNYINAVVKGFKYHIETGNKVKKISLGILVCFPTNKIEPTFLLTLYQLINLIVVMNFHQTFYCY